MAKRMKVCSLSKLNLLKFAKQQRMRCYPRATGRIVDKKVGADDSPRERAFARVGLTGAVVFCCGKRLGRHRRAGRRRRRASRDWRRAYRAHASYRRRRRR